MTKLAHFFSFKTPGISISDKLCDSWIEAPKKAVEALDIDAAPHCVELGCHGRVQRPCRWRNCRKLGVFGRVLKTQSKVARGALDRSGQIERMTEIILND
jgi:hypothetical protein